VEDDQNTVTNDIYPVEVVGSVSGLAAFGNGLGGAVFTWMTGHIVQHFSYDAVSSSWDFCIRRLRGVSVIGEKPVCMDTRR